MLSHVQASRSFWTRAGRPTHRLNFIAAASAKLSVKIPKHVEFGESVAIVGSIPELGAWSPASALPLTWTAPDLWHLDIDLPAGQEIEYKYIIQKGSAEEVEWQAGDNLTISLPEAATLDTWDAGHDSVEISSGEVVASGGEEVVAEEEPEELVAAVEAPSAVDDMEDEISAVLSSLEAPTRESPASNILPGPIRTAGKAVVPSEEAEVAV